MHLGNKNINILYKKKIFFSYLLLRGPESQYQIMVWGNYLPIHSILDHLL
jgi:hypothetical protein